MLSPLRVVVLTGLALVACQSSPHLSVTMQEAISTPTPTVTFPNTQVGTTSSAITIQINPVSYSYNTIQAVTETCSDFAVNAMVPGYAYRTCEPIGCANAEQCPVAAAAPPCGPGSETEPYYFTATFTPNVAATSSCQVAVVANTGTIYITLTGIGTVPPLSADTQPASYNFGDVRRNTDSSTGTITVRNTGGQTLNVSNVTVNSVYSLVGGTATSFSLAPGGTRAIGVTCRPTAVGSAPGTFTVTSNYSPLNVPLSCNGIDSALDITPSPLTIPTTRVGEPRTQSVTLRNSGSAPMMLSSVALAGAGMVLDSAPAPNTMLAVNGTAIATVRFDAAASGDAAGILTVMYDSASRTSQVSAHALTTSMSMSPTGTVDLGPVCMGQSANRSFQIIANDQGPFAVSSISMPAGAFSVNATGLPAAIQGAGVNNYQFTVSASPIELGPQTAMLTVTTDIPNAEPQTTEIKVEGLAEGVNGSPADLDLGGVPVGSNTVGQTVTITNCTTDSVTLSNVRIEGVDAAEFSVVDYPDSLDIGSTQNGEFLVIAGPNSVGVKEAIFKVDHPGGTISINLLGDGLGDDPGGPGEEGDDGRPSYYACSTGHAAHAWPLLFAMWLLRRRRR
ncbi:MAG: choice-of-anchor D domain-containing protein [Kofleriaceae bacterium]